MLNQQPDMVDRLTPLLVQVISETNGINLDDTLELLCINRSLKADVELYDEVQAFRRNLWRFHQDEIPVSELLDSCIAGALFQFLKNFPLPYHEEHIHLTGSLSAEFIFPRLQALLAGPGRLQLEQKIVEVYGEQALPINSIEDVENLITLKEGELFSTYLQILYLAKTILISREVHREAAYHMASTLYEKYNVGKIRLKFTLARSSGISSEQIPGAENVTEADVVLGLYDGFMDFQRSHPFFEFILSPSFRKEAQFYDQEHYASKTEHFSHQVNSILTLLDNHPELKPHLCEVDTVGDEKNFYRKAHFQEMKRGLRKLQDVGFRIRSHHGETWKTLRKGVQSVDNAMNMWHVDTVEHGLSLGINPNYYFHHFYQRVLDLNQLSVALVPGSIDYEEITDMEWSNESVKDKLLAGQPLDDDETRAFVKTKFHTAREIEQYQHDILNRMLDKQISLVALPSSNLKLTGSFPDYKDHPFSWWEKKGVELGVGTDNYVTLQTNFIQELLLILFSDPQNLKITKLLMVATKETRRPHISHLLWLMRKQYD
jgi:adenosine deaminase